MNKFNKTIISKCFALFFAGIAGLILFNSFTGAPSDNKKKVNIDHPKIVNIVNFIRLLEPRDPKITEDVLYQTVVKQVELMKKYKLGGTFLLQYDALIDPRYQKLLKSLPRNSFEIAPGGKFHSLWLKKPD